MSKVSVIERWVTHFNNHDVDGVMSLYRSDATLHVAFAEPIAGAEAIRASFTTYFAAAKLHCIVQHLYEAQGSRVALEWKDRVGLLGVNIFELEGELIQNQRNYFDQMSFFRLNGIPLPKE
jgi:hypothetical protein